MTAKEKAFKSMAEYRQNYYPGETEAEDETPKALAVDLAKALLQGLAARLSGNPLPSDLQATGGDDVQPLVMLSAADLRRAGSRSLAKHVGTTSMPV